MNISYLNYSAVTWAFSVRAPSHAAKLVLLAIAAHVDEAGRGYPASDRLSAITGVSTRGVTRAIAELEQAGLIEVNRASWRGNTYALCWDGKQKSYKVAGHAGELSVPDLPLFAESESSPPPDTVSGPLDTVSGITPKPPDTVSRGGGHSVYPPPTQCLGGVDVASTKETIELTTEPIREETPPYPPQGGGDDLLTELGPASPDRAGRESPPSRRRNPAVLAESMREIWNGTCGKSLRGSVALKLTPNRISQSYRRLIEDFGGELDQWRAYCQRLAVSSLLSTPARPGPHANWRADFDWAIKPTTIVRTLEGNYDDRGQAEPVEEDRAPAEPDPENDPIFGEANQIKLALIGAMMAGATPDDPQVIALRARHAEALRLAQQKAAEHV